MNQLPSEPIEPTEPKQPIEPIQLVGPTEPSQAQIPVEIAEIAAKTAGTEQSPQATQTPNTDSAAQTSPATAPSRLGQASQITPTSPKPITYLLPRKKAVRKRRDWNLTLATAEVWQQDPAFNELAAMVLNLSRINNKISSKLAINAFREKAQSLRSRLPPLTASALTKVIRRTEAACGAVLDKGARVKEVEASWEHFLACLLSKEDSPPV